VVLVRLDEVKVGSLALREAVLAVKLELASNDRVLTPAVHVKSSLSKNECTSIRDTRVLANVSSTVIETLLTTSMAVVLAFSQPADTPESGCCFVNVTSTSIMEEARVTDVVSCLITNALRAREGMKSVRESINSIGVVERLGAKGLEKKRLALKGRAVVNVLVRLDNPDKLLHRVVEVKLDLVAGRTNGLVTSELNLLDEVLMRVLCHTTALISVKEYVVNVERSSYEGLVVCSGRLDGAGISARKGGDSPEALINRTDVKVDADLVVLKSDKRKSKSRVAAVPELERHVKGGLRKSVARSAYLARSAGIARSIDVSERRISDVGKLGGVANHLVVSTLLFLGKSKLVPDVHVVTVLAINALATNLDLNLSDHLLSREIKPASELGKLLVDLRKSYLKVGAVSEVTVTGKSAGNTAAEISLAVESLLN